VPVLIRWMLGCFQQPAHRRCEAGGMCGAMPKDGGVGEREHEKMSAGYVLNTKDRSPNTGAAGKGLLRVCASCNVGPHARSAENSLRSTKQRRTAAEGTWPFQGAKGQIKSFSGLQRCLLKISTHRIHYIIYRVQEFCGASTPTTLFVGTACIHGPK
jgi:hypothetical protein